MGVVSLKTRDILIFKKEILDRIAGLECELKTVTNKKDARKLNRIIAELKNAYTLFKEDEIEYFLFGDIICQNFDCAEKMGAITKQLEGFGHEFKSIKKERLSKSANYGLSTKEVSRYLYDFYMSFGEPFSTIFAKLFYNFENNHLFLSDKVFSGLSGGMIPAPTLGEMFSYSVMDGSIHDVLNVVHEFGHGIELFSNLKGATNENKLFFSEVVSIFFELVALDDLKCSLLDEKEFKLTHCQFVQEYASTIDNATLLAKMAKIGLEVVDKDEKTAFNIIGKGINLSSKKVRSLITYDINTEYKYAIGFAYAVELLMIYIEDQDYALYLLEQFIKLGGYCPEDIMYKLDNLGLTIGKRVAEYKLLLK